MSEKKTSLHGSAALMIGKCDKNKCFEGDDKAFEDASTRNRGVPCNLWQLR